MRSTETPPDFGARLRAARGYLDLTVGQMAQRMGRNRATIRAWELDEVKHDEMKLPTLIDRYSEISGMPRWFFEVPDLKDLSARPAKPSTAAEKAKKAKQAIRQGKAQAARETRPRKQAGS